MRRATLALFESIWVTTTLRRRGTVSGGPMSCPRARVDHSRGTSGITLRVLGERYGVEGAA